MPAQFCMGPQINLGQLIDELAKADPTQRVSFDFPNANPDDLSSYRGYYEDLAIQTIGGGGGPLVRDLLATLVDAVGKEFHGYKGGIYVMSRKTPVWVSNWGECTGRAVTGVRRGDFRTTITTEVVD